MKITHLTQYLALTFLLGSIFVAIVWLVASPSTSRFEPFIVILTSLGSLMVMGISKTGES